MHSQNMKFLGFFFQGEIAHPISGRVTQFATSDFTQSYFSFFIVSISMICKLNTVNIFILTRHLFEICAIPAIKKMSTKNKRYR